MEILINILLFWCICLVFSSFFKISFCFVSFLILLELLNVSFLFYIYIFYFSLNQYIFILAMVVATVEATISLVCLSRVWDLDSISY